MPTAIRPTQSDDPPYEMNGSVIPVMGTRLATTAMFSQAWKASQAVMPVARSAPSVSGARSARRVPRRARTRNRTTTPSVPTSPSSFPSTAKIESVYAAGRKPNFSFPAPRPSPKAPPSASP